MNIFKTSMLSGIATLVRICSGLILTKVVAIFAGPSGLATIGQLQNFVNMVMLLAGDFLKTATTKYTSEYSNDLEKKKKIWSSSVKIIFTLNLFITIFIYTFSRDLSEYLLKSEDYEYVFKVFAFSLPLFVVNSFFLSILNGQRDIKLYIKLNIMLSVISLILVVSFTYLFGLKGALVSYVINQSVVLIITICAIRNKDWFKFKYFYYKAELSVYRNIFGFAIITFVSISTSNITIVSIRSYILNNLSSHDAGNWQAVWSLSQVAMSLITVSLSTYLLPTISSLSSKKDLSKEIYSALTIVIPLSLTATLIAYYGRDLIIILLYSTEFKDMRPLFLFQFLGNAIKVCGWVFGYVLVAKGMVKYTVSTEVFFAMSFYFLVKIFVDEFGIVGTTYAFFMNSLLHALCMIYVYRFRVK